MGYWKDIVAITAFCGGVALVAHLFERWFGAQASLRNIDFDDSDVF